VLIPYLNLSGKAAEPDLQQEHVSPDHKLRPTRTGLIMAFFSNNITKRKLIMTTTISVMGAIGKGFDIANTVSPSLNEEYWSNLSSSVPNKASSTNTMQFNRDEGMKDNKSWTFTTALTLDGVDILLQEEVTGTWDASTMKQSITAGSETTGFIDTNDDKTLIFCGKSGAKYAISWSLSGLTFKDIQYIIKLTKPAYKPIPPVMAQIETVVFLMMENRSLDNMLGWLYDSGLPAVVYPADSSPRFDGIPADAKNDYHKTSYSPAKGTSGYRQPCRVPEYDPNEPIDHVEKQLYASAEGKMPEGYFWSTTPPMTGFAWDYYAIYENQPGQVMGAYNAEQLPVMYGLATKFAVSDRWFCSVPTQTDPNRAFSVCGTSLGAQENSDINDSTYANSSTIFNALGSNDKTWGMYWQSENPLGTGEPLDSFAPYTSYYFNAIDHADNGSVEPYANFSKQLAEGTLPNFCFLEPFWGGGKGVPGTYSWVGLQGNDYHPPAWIGPAESDLNDLYNALVASKQWPNMLFVITFDEHGGTYDHVAPPVTVAPDDNVAENGFAFDRMGVRVPMILVSPFIAEGTVFRAPTGSKYDFDHTSFIATMLKWAGVDPSSANMGTRVAVAPTFEDVLVETARPDKPSFTVPESYKSQGGGTGHFNTSLDTKVQRHNTPLDVRTFREILDTSDDHKEFVEKLNSLAQRK
jgi:phospholipase C